MGKFLPFCGANCSLISVGVWKIFRHLAHTSDESSNGQEDACVAVRMAQANTDDVESFPHAIPTRSRMTSQQIL